MSKKQNIKIANSNPNFVIYSADKVFWVMPKKNLVMSKICCNFAKKINYGFKRFIKMDLGCSKICFVCNHHIVVFRRLPR